MLPRIAMVRSSKDPCLNERLDLCWVFAYKEPPGCFNQLQSQKIKGELVQTACINIYPSNRCIYIQYIYLYIGTIHAKGIPNLLIFGLLNASNVAIRSKEVSRYLKAMFKTPRVQDCPFTNPWWTVLKLEKLWLLQMPFISMQKHAGLSAFHSPEICRGNVPNRSCKSNAPLYLDVHIYI